jgi:Coenzyme F390 synthetase
MKYYNEKIETMSRAEMTALQSERLVAQIKRVYERVPYYRAKMDAAGVKPTDIKSVADIVKLPFTVKTDLRANYPFGLFGCDRKDVVRVHASSGTTGKLTVVGYTKNDLNNWAECCARAFVSAGADENSMVHIAYGYGLFTGGFGLHYGAEKLGATAVPVSSGNTMRQVMLLKDFGSNVLACTPSYAVYLAEEIAKEGLKPEDLGLKIGIFGAEPWTEEMRREIESKLKIKAYDIYGLSEISGPGVSMECSEQNGKHVYEDFFYPEILDPITLEPVPYGQKGELVFTTLTKECIPLIRYRTRDICSLDDTPCKCGRTLIKMTRIEGRSDDMLIIRGVNVFPSQIETVLLNIGGAIGPHYQIILDRVGSLDTMEIQVELNEKAFSDEVKVIEKLKSRIEHDMQSMLGISAKITIVSPHSIPRSEGKAKRIIDNRKY